MKNLIFILLLIVSTKVFSQIDTYSKSPCLVTMFNTKIPFKVATGFFYSTKTKTYFITNNHVVGGEFYINEYRKSHKSIIVPDDSLIKKISIRLYDTRIGKTFDVQIPINEKSYIIFYSDSQNKQLMDAVAIPINDAIKIQLKGVYVLSNNDINNDLNLSPGMELFITGFPSDPDLNNIYPIWKRGTIASEPNLKEIGNYFFIIDATTRKGMSGSPVFIRGSIFNTKQAPNTIYGGVETFLIGVYNSQLYSMELGGVIDFSKIKSDLDALDN